MNFLGIDIGTTCCKCQLFSEKGEILEYKVKEYGFLKRDGFNYVDIDAIWQNVKGMIKEVAKTNEISSICISSLGESFVLLDDDDNVLFYPMLYTDSRGEDEAKEILEKIGGERAFKITGVLPHSMYSISKILYIKNNYPEVFAKAKKVMLVCDYVGYLLSGKRVIDYSLASRTGAFDVSALEFSNEILLAFGLDKDLFSKPMRAGAIVGEIKSEIIDELSVKGNPVLVLGSHDQVCTSIGAGALSNGDAVDGMGTVECITVLFDKKPEDYDMGKMGYPCVPYAVEGLYCTYILNYSCGSTINWFKKEIMHEYKEEEKNFFDYLEGKMKDGPTGILTLPYFGGASTPYQDLSAKGAIVNLTTTTTDADVYKSIMEGTAFEMCFNAETVKTFGIDLKNIVATGGGANSKTWMQIKADVQNVSIKTLRSSEGGLCGTVMLSAVALGSIENLEKAREIFVRYNAEFIPNKDKNLAYQNDYAKYKKLYKCIKEVNTL